MEHTAKNSARRREFIRYLNGRNLAQNTITSYLWTLDFYTGHYKSFSKKNLQSFKSHLAEHYPPSTVNLRIHGINAYLTFIRKEKSRLSFVKEQRRTFLENVISNEDYEYFKKSLKKDGKEKWYFVVWFLGATGARISELVQIKKEHVVCGHMDICSKGKKVRRIYFPRSLQKDALEWLGREGIKAGRIFLNRFGSPLSTRGIAIQLKTYAAQYGLDTKTVHPHSFRHRFAKNFLACHNDIALLADLLGHESIETTRIYLRQTSTEQQHLIDRIVQW